MVFRYHVSRSERNNNEKHLQTKWELELTRIYFIRSNWSLERRWMNPIIKVLLPISRTPQTVSLVATIRLGRKWSACAVIDWEVSASAAIDNKLRRVTKLTINGCLHENRKRAYSGLTERCASLQGFLIFRSFGGGTGRQILSFNEVFSRSIVVDSRRSWWNSSRWTTERRRNSSSACTPRRKCPRVSSIENYTVDQVWTRTQSTDILEGAWNYYRNVY